MGLWSWLGRRKPTTGANDMDRVVPDQPKEQESLTPEQLAELKDAWAELAEAAKESAVTGFHACSRGGKPWQEDPAAVRSLAALIRSIDKDGAATKSLPSA
jgi:acyl-CoA reductase-like NAD-dependent aldehyde dehydrogenase